MKGGSKMKEYEMVIGLEVHCELSTESKIFCGCSTKFGGEPNTHVCEVCSGMPGTLPTLNRKVVEYAVKTGLALNCEITRKNKFDRKNYFYPDLPKAYQISQLYFPICRNGHVDIKTSEGTKSIGIHEIHMEEDAGKLVHDPVTGMTMVDFNRCGVPLLEIVSEPDFRSAEEVTAYLTKLRDTMQYLGVSDCKMQEGSMRADVNLSVRPVGQKEFGTRTEMKNIASFKAIERAIEYERDRQIDLIEEGGKVVQETRRWDDEKEYTYAMRSKENAQDYKYFPDPDLMPIEISEEYLDEVKKNLPEFADAKRERYVRDMGLPEYDAEIITGATTLVTVFETASEMTGSPKDVSNWIMTDLPTAGTWARSSISYPRARSIVRRDDRSWAWYSQTRSIPKSTSRPTTWRRYPTALLSSPSSGKSSRQTRRLWPNTSEAPRRTSSSLSASPCAH